MRFDWIVLQVKYASADGVGFMIWRHTFKIAPMTPFYTEKCCQLVSAHETSARRSAHAAASGGCLQFSLVIWGQLFVWVCFMVSFFSFSCIAYRFLLSSIMASLRETGCRKDKWICRAERKTTRSILRKITVEHVADKLRLFFCRKPISSWKPGFD